MAEVTLGLGIVGENVARLRGDRGLSQEALAEAAGLSRVAVQKIEGGATEPDGEIVSKLARALRASLRDLRRPVRPLRTVRFRAPRRIKGRDQILAEVSSWLDDYAWLERELPDELLGSRPLDLQGPTETPEGLATRARHSLRLGPGEIIRDICGLLEERARIKVLLLNRQTDTFFGLSVAAEDGGPAVVVNTWERISVERWIFTAAHEVGHLLLHPQAYDRSEVKQDDREEKEADRFASHFLMPDEVFETEWNERRGLNLLDRVLKVKRIFRVSYKTVLYRLVESGRESSDVWRLFQIQHKQRFKRTLRKTDEGAEALRAGEFRLNWGRSGEPAALIENDFVHDRLHGLVRRALERETIPLGRAAEILRIPLEDMRDLTADWTGPREP